jgi:uncharacterized membrane protein YqjE
VRGLWLLPKAAPALMRHIGVYIELIALDLARAQREITAQVLVAAVAAICMLFAVLMACMAVVAYTWDTAYRVATIAWMSGGFLVIAVVAVIYMSRLARARTPPLTDLKREWQEDRIILERILSSDEE